MLKLAGWRVRLSTYEMGNRYYCTADNVDPGACLTRTEGKNREEAEQMAIDRVKKYVSKTRRFSTLSG